MLKAYETIRKELGGKSDESSQRHHNYGLSSEYDEQHNRYRQPMDSNSDNRFQSYEDRDRHVISSYRPSNPPVEERAQESIMSPKHAPPDYSTAPSSALQWSLTSAEDGDISTKLQQQQQTQPRCELNIDKLCEDLYDVNMKDNEPPELVDKRSTPMANESSTNEIEDNNLNRNVHFAKHNEMYSATESEDHSLTDVTSMRLEESEDYEEENNDSTCVESSLDLNNTFKSELVKEEMINDVRYEDDFDD